jgi:predicted amidohydrolase YtcJ
MTFVGVLMLAAAAASLPPDTIYFNGKIITVNDTFDVVEAVAIQSGRFVAVGSDEDVRPLAGASTRLIDLGGRTVLPGFYDNHIHLGPGRGLQRWKEGFIPAVAEWCADADTMDKLMAALVAKARATSKGEWIRGGLTRPDWPNDKIPNRWQLDEVTTEHPVLLTRGPHTFILNSLALELAGIDETTPDPEGGWIIRDANGLPSGRVLESARRLVTRVLPPEPPVEFETGLQQMKLQLEQLMSLGVTSVNIAGVRPRGVRGVQELYSRWGASLPRATMQIRLSPGHDSYDDAEEGIRNSIAELESMGFRTGFGDHRLRLGAVKMSIDGGLSAPIFWSLEPYKGKPGLYGAIRIPSDIFYPVAKRAHDLGWQLGIHTMGDGAVVMVVDELERILKESPRDDHRHYLHHVAVKPPEETLRKMATLGIMVSSQPAFTVGLGGFAAEALTPDREATQNPTKSLLDHGIRVSHGSDSAPYGPLLTIWTAVTRTGWQGKVYGPEEAVSVEEAIRLHTIAPAYMTFEEDVKGSIEVGKLADMVVLDKDILSITPARLRSIAVERTIVGGRELYRK